MDKKRGKAVRRLGIEQGFENFFGVFFGQMGIPAVGTGHFPEYVVQAGNLQTVFLRCIHFYSIRSGIASRIKKILCSTGLWAKSS